MARFKSLSCIVVSMIAIAAGACSSAPDSATKALNIAQGVKASDVLASAGSPTRVLRSATPEWGKSACSMDPASRQAFEYDGYPGFFGTLSRWLNFEPPVTVIVCIDANDRVIRTDLLQS